MLPMPQTTLLFYSLSHKYPEPLVSGEAVWRLVLLSPRLDALQVNLLFAANLDISAFCLLPIRQSELGLVMM